MAELMIQYGYRTWVLDKIRPILSAGRSTSNDLVIPEPCVSRYHLRFECHPDGFYLVDLSNNGTYIYEPDGREVFLHQAQYRLTGKLKLVLGRQWQGETDEHVLHIDAASPEESNPPTLVWQQDNNLVPFVEYLSTQVEQFLLVVDENLHIQYANRVWQVLTGGKGTKGKDLVDFFAPEEKEVKTGLILSTILQGTYTSTEVKLRLANGDETCVLQVFSRRFLKMDGMGAFVWGGFGHGSLLRLGYLGGRYEIKKLLSAGEFCHTYLGCDHGRPRETPCIIKQLHTEGLEPDMLPTARRLFYNEALTLDELGEHPGIPRLLAYLERDGQFYLVQEYIEGQNLREVSLSWDEAEIYHFLMSMLGILDYVHGRGVLHRDIKPENIIRRPDGSYALIDFGSVKRIPELIYQQKGFRASTPTVPVGTPGYTAPEQRAGYPVPASDLYALGAVAIELWTGQVYAEHPEGCWSRIPPRWRGFFERLLWPSPEGRHESAEAAREALVRLANP